MIQLKADEAAFQHTLAGLHVDLADSEEQLAGKREELKATTKEKEAIEAYLLKIKPGCDFITDNIDTRKQHRVTEGQALESAVTFLKGTPAYVTAVAEAHNESLGDCLASCTGQEDHVECKACLASVTIPGYCAGHPTTTGC